MKCDYDDIISRIKEPILWWDEHAVPRYVTFHPSEAANIYAREVALLQVDCQNCGRVFRVAMSSDMMAEALKLPLLSALITSQDIHYGDPPNVGCCPGGPTMNSVPRRVLEFWRRRLTREWERDKSLEIAICTTEARTR
jgi:hypothetical protein